MNVIERAILLCKTTEIGTADLPYVFHGAANTSSVFFPGSDFNTEGWTDKTLPEVQREVLDKVEQTCLELVLKKTRGQLEQTARIAGIHPRNLYNKMRRLGLNKETFKTRSQ